MPNSLLLTLLTEEPAYPKQEQAKKVPITPQNHPELPITQAIADNIDEVFEAINPDPSVQHPSSDTPNLKKDVARKQLYKTLYSIIEKEYDEPEKDEGNLTFNRAIAMALENAIQEVYARQADGKDISKEPIILLRNALRKKIVEALKPKGDQSQSLLPA
jgi:hypothetical protein